MLTTLLDPFGPRPLGLTRIVIGGAAVIRSLIALPVLLELAEPAILRIPVVQWMPDPTVTVAWVSFAVWAVAGLLVCIGWRVAWSGPILILALAFHMLLDQQLYANHLYLMSWLVLLLVVADAGAGRSVERRSRDVACWTLLLIMLQASVVYFFSGVTKINDEFLGGVVLAGILHDGVIAFPDSLKTADVLVPMAVATIVVEVFLAFALWIPGLRIVAYVAGIGLHLGITLLMADTGELLVFSLLMLACYPLFAQVRPRTPRAELSRSAA